MPARTSQQRPTALAHRFRLASLDALRAALRTEPSVFGRKQLGWRRSSALLACALIVLATAGCPRPQENATASPVSAIDDAALKDAEARPADWLLHGRTYAEQRYSPLAEINADNVDQLGLAWWYDTRTDRGLEATPIVVDGVIYTTGSWSVVYAIDGRTGEELWRWNPEVDKAYGRYACCDVVNRGVAVYDGKVYVGVLDGRLAALDAASGEVVWQVQTTDPEQPYTITGAPRVVQGKVLIGNGGAEYGVRGYLDAYDAKTGERAWRFYTVPGNPADGFENEAMERAAKTWNGEWWTMGGGGTVWDSMAYDPELDLLYVGTGNGSPWNRQIRSPGGGDNLYLSSIVALRPDSGEMVWYYQTTPGESWDFTATQQIILADLTIDEKPRKVLMQAPKNGFFYVLDRTDGSLISAQPYVQINWATGVDLETGRPMEVEAARYVNAPSLVMPAPLGGHNWQPMAFDPENGLVYIPALEIPGMYGNPTDFKFVQGMWNLGQDPTLTDAVPPEVVSGHLTAWDPVAQKEVWRVEYPLPWAGGVLATAGGLVFQGVPGGTFAAYRAEDGEKLWETQAGTGIVAAPVTYSIDGEQYVAVMAGWGGAYALFAGDAARAAGVHSKPGRLLVYKLGGTASLPAEPAPAPEEISEIPSNASEQQVHEGFVLFNSYCMVCHGYGVVGGGETPDLRLSDPGVFDSWADIVLGGRLQNQGMPSFAETLDQTQLEEIKAYVLSRRELARQAQTQPQ